MARFHAVTQIKLLSVVLHILNYSGINVILVISINVINVILYIFLKTGIITDEYFSNTLKKYMEFILYSYAYLGVCRCLTVFFVVNINYFLDTVLITFSSSYDKNNRHEKKINGLTMQCLV